MNSLEKHEVYEIETLDNMKNARFLEPLVFGGGTMLRLCHELNRYSSDLDFWFVKEVDVGAYFERLRDHLGSLYEVTDAQEKHFTLLLEIRSGSYPRRLKIEIRKEMKDVDFQDRIAFSKSSAKQVILRTHTLEQTMSNKISAALERKDIRDCFDIEFLLRKGIALPSEPDRLAALREVGASFKKNDFKVTLGSVLDAEAREYYVENGFSYMLELISPPLYGVPENLFPKLKGSGPQHSSRG